MTSHQYAQKLKAASDFLLSRPEFSVPNDPLLFASYWSNKEGFIAAVKAVGTGEKKYDGDYLKFIVPVADGVTFDIEVNRSLSSQRSQPCTTVNPCSHKRRKRN